MLKHSSAAVWAMGMSSLILSERPLYRPHQPPPRDLRNDGVSDIGSLRKVGRIQSEAKTVLLSRSLPLSHLMPSVRVSDMISPGAVGYNSQRSKKAWQCAENEIWDMPLHNLGSLSLDMIMQAGSKSLLFIPLVARRKPLDSEGASHAADGERDETF